MPAPGRWWRTCSRSPASRRSGAEPPAKSPIDFSNRRRRFLAISGDPDGASVELRRLAADARLDLRAALDSFDQRVGFLAARGMKLHEFVYAAAFVRDLDYYTGFVFEAVDAAAPGSRPVLGGGRYDGLARHMGASSDLPAVGAAIWVERLPLAGGSR
jgi:ATP phosphoribosyltransferase regulatory subunit